MPAYSQINGVLTETKEMHAMVGGLQREITEGYAMVGGVLRQVFSSARAVPLGDLAIGDTVKIAVDGVVRDFLMVQHGPPSSIYDVSFDGGTVLLMKDIYESRQWHSSNSNSYSNSAINSYLNSTLLGLVDANVRPLIRQVKIPYRPNAGQGKTINSGANGLPVYLWLLSDYEMNWTTSTDQYMVADGATLAYFAGSPTANPMRIAYLNGVATNWWLRSPYTNAATLAWYVYTSGTYGYNSCTTSYGIRPALVLPDTVLVDNNGNIVI